MQAEDNFVLKLIQLEELLFVRHSVFVIGFAGTGKTKVVKIFCIAFKNLLKLFFLTDIFFTVLTKLNSGLKINEQVLSKPKKAAGMGRSQSKGGDKRRVVWCHQSSYS